MIIYILTENFVSKCKECVSVKQSKENGSYMITSFQNQKYIIERQKISKSYQKIFHLV
jgi:hypothetical protein